MMKKSEFDDEFQSLKYLGRSFVSMFFKEAFVWATSGTAVRYLKQRVKLGHL